MHCKLFFILSLRMVVFCERFYSVAEEDSDEEGYVEIEDRSVQAHPEIYDVSREPRFIPEDKVSSESLEQGASLDRIDFHYPQVEFLTKNDYLESEYGKIVTPQKDELVLVQSQIIEPPGEEGYYGNTIPKRKYDKVNKTHWYYYPTQLSYVQTSSKPSKYEELEVITVTPENNSLEGTKRRIGALLKRYLVKLYKKKYNSTIDTSPSPTLASPKLGQAAEPSIDPPKTKYIDGSLWNFKNKTLTKIKKIFSLFTIVKFNNTQCNVTYNGYSYLGVCYTAGECQRLGGTSVGTCAAGYGVCCIFRGSCGGSASQNCSYFESPNYPDYYPSGNMVIIPTTQPPPATTSNPSPTPDPRLTWPFSKNGYKYGIEERQGSNVLSCTFNVYKSNPSVNRMRIDFVDLELAGPINGTCTVERLVIMGQDGNDVIPDICGYNTGQHIYVDVSTLTGPLQISVLSTMSYRKRFRLQICQFKNSCMEPANNCLQYYTGVNGVISTFNYDQAAMFNRSRPGYIWG
ncbi:unnamed protein product [Acanthoscelides obtectus]|uniref:CUB domain-containing protein n=1 Tax=Acanthoscelides obtectus TaxID=200917 RepID=A0A9P0K0R3_ACAOB|nr:unnamed protein product [Acanthoscelides obtectus]CAK1638039.1 hypothetical protein AOBTE_LOCUS10354 [Acanthoscelides obtectus]